MPIKLRLGKQRNIWMTRCKEVSLKLDNLTYCIALHHVTPLLSNRKAEHEFYLVLIFLHSRGKTTQNSQIDIKCASQ